MKQVLAVAVLLLLAACSDPTDPQPSGPPSSTPTRPATAAPAESDDPELAADGRPIRLGVLVGARLRDVRPRLDELGLHVDVRRRARCVPGVVLVQEPAPGTNVERGSTVRLVVARAPAAATCIVPPGMRASDQLLQWALGKTDPPRFAHQVRLLIGNRPVAHVARRQARNPDAWNLRVTAYAERDEVRILEALAAGPVRGAAVPPYSCQERAQELPADLVRRLPWAWSLTTVRADACMQLASVQVWADAEGRITDVNVLMGSP